MRFPHLFHDKFLDLSGKKERKGRIVRPVTASSEEGFIGAEFFFFVYYLLAHVHILFIPHILLDLC